MKKMIMISGVILAIAFAGTTYGVPPGQPFQELLDLINGIAARVTALETSGGGGATRVVLSGTIDLNSGGGEVREAFDRLGRRRVSHFEVFLIPDLTTTDPPTVTLYRRRHTSFVASVIGATEFVVHRYGNDPDEPPAGPGDATLLIFAEGKILLRFRQDVFNFDGTVTKIFGLDGPGGTGEFRLVLVR